MSTSTRSGWDRFLPTPTAVVGGVLVLNTEFLLALAYLSRPGVTPASLDYLVYPFVWINVGLWAMVRTYPVVETSVGGGENGSGEGRSENGSGGIGVGRNWSRHRLVAGAIGVGYFLLVAYAGGLVGPSDVATGFRIATLPPGFGPALLYGNATFQLVLEPFKVVGYLALAYLVYATTIDAAGSAIGGVVGLLSCVSCTWPVLATLASGVFGSSVGIANAALGQAYGLSTLVFVLTVGLLYWRPFGPNG